MIAVHRSLLEGSTVNRVLECKIGPHTSQDELEGRAADQNSFSGNKVMIIAEKRKMASNFWR